MMSEQGRGMVDPRRTKNEAAQSALSPHKPLPPVGATVNLRWAGRFVQATVVEHKGGSLLDLDHMGITLLSVGYGQSGWLHLTPSATELTSGDEH